MGTASPRGSQSRVKAFLPSSLLQTSVHGSNPKAGEERWSSVHGRGPGSGPQRPSYSGCLRKVSLDAQALLLWPKPVTGLPYFKDCGVVLNPTNGAL